MSGIERVGTSIRKLRKQRKMTLQQLSEAVGLSVGYLSYLERNEKSPTLVNMARICEALNTSMADLLELNSQEKVVIRKDEREITVDEASNVRIETVDFGKEYGNYLYMTMEPGGSFDGTFWEHKCHEIGTILSGTMAVQIEGDRYELEEGDTVLIKAHSRHCCYNLGDKPVIAFWSRFWPDEKPDAELLEEEEE